MTHLIPCGNTCQTCGKPINSKRARYCPACRPHWGGSKPGERNGFAKLASEDVLAIRDEVGTQEEIAREYGCSRSNISIIQCGKGWKHL